jgi:DNA modification methylase
LADLGISYPQSSRWQLLAMLPDEEYESFKDAVRADTEKVITQSAALAVAKHYQRERDKRDRAVAEAAGLSLVPTIRRARALDWLAEQPNCDLLLTDPPYSTDVPDVAEFAHDWLPAALKKVKATGRAYVCIGAYPHELAAYLEVPSGDFTLANVLVWTYRNTLGPSPTHDYKLNWQAILYYRGPDAPRLNCPEMTEQFTVQDINAPDGRHGDRWHAWQKPDELGNRFVRHASRPGDLVLDPFAGTGTFLLSAARLGRRAAGCDVDEDNIAIAVERGCAVEE